MQCFEGACRARFVAVNGAVIVAGVRFEIVQLVANDKIIFGTRFLKCGLHGVFEVLSRAPFKINVASRTGQVAFVIELRGSGEACLQDGGGGRDFAGHRALAEIGVGSGAVDEQTEREGCEGYFFKCVHFRQSNLPCGVRIRSAIL